MKKSVLRRTSHQLTGRTSCTTIPSISIPTSTSTSISISLSRHTSTICPAYGYNCTAVANSRTRTRTNNAIVNQPFLQQRLTISSSRYFSSSPSTSDVAATATTTALTDNEDDDDDRDAMITSSLSLQQEQMNINNNVNSNSNSNNLLSLLSEDQEFQAYDIDPDSDFDTDTDNDTDTDSPITSSTTNLTSSKKKKKKKKRMKQPKTSNLISKNLPTQQSKANANVLFDYIAPHVDKEVLQQLLSDMKELTVAMEAELLQQENKKAARKKKLNLKHSKSSMSMSMNITNKQLKDYQTLLGRVDALFKRNNKKKGRAGRGKPSRKKADARVDSLEDFPWIKSLIAQFFAGAEERHGVGASVNVNEDPNANSTGKENMPAPLSMELLWRDPTFTPNVNRKTRSETVSTLMHAREMTLESPLLWSNKQRRRVKKKRGEEAWEKEKRDEHYQKTAEQLMEEAESMASLLSFRLPEKAHGDVVALFKLYADNVAETVVKLDCDEIRGKKDTDYSESEIEDAQKKIDNDGLDGDSKPHIEIMKMLLVNLKKKTGFHVHLVAMELANFLYVDLPLQAVSDALIVDAVDDMDELPSVPLGRSDVRVNESWNDWNSLRDDLVDVFLSSQHMHVKLQSAVKKSEIKTLEKKQKKEIAKSGLKEDELEKTMIKYSNDATKRTDELLAELDLLRTTEGGDLVGRSPVEQQRAGRAPKAAHLRFECLMLNGMFGPYSNAETAFVADLDSCLSRDVISPELAMALPETNKTVFVDNLPIDVTREELEYLYSRCGGIESIEIFNLRPDLDPGELSNKQVMERKKKNRMSGMKGAKQISSQRSPVYAMIKFEDEKGYESATIDILRIFGMVIRRHAVKSHPARNIHTIFIEGIPQGRFAMDFEEKLSKLLKPNMYISLMLGQHVNAQAKSCEIIFPTFEVAYYAHQQLHNFKTGDADEKCVIDWMKTPENAMAYWTRDLSPNNS